MDAVMFIKVIMTVLFVWNGQAAKLEYNTNLRECWNWKMGAENWEDTSQDFFNWGKLTNGVGENRIEVQCYYPDTDREA